MQFTSKHIAARLSAALVAILAIGVVFASVAGAATVKLRVEGAKKTHFNGKVQTTGGIVPGGTNTAACPANGENNLFTTPNPLTALVQALGSNKVGTSGKNYDWGVMLCSVGGEKVTGAGGWMVRINQKDSTLPAGFATATTELKSGDSVLLYYSPSYGYYNYSLELTGPSRIKKGKKATFKVKSYLTANDTKVAVGGLKVTVGKYSGKTNSKGQVKIKLKKAGKFLARVSAPGSIRGTTWVTVKKK